MAEYKLSFTAQEIDEKLREVDNLSEEMANLDASVNGGEKTVTGYAKYEFEYGSVGSDAGNLVQNKIRMRSPAVPVETGENSFGLVVFNNSAVEYVHGVGYLGNVFVTTVGKYYPNVDMSGGVFAITSDGTFDRVRLVFAKKDGSEFTKEEVSESYIITNEEVTTTVRVGGLVKDIENINDKLDEMEYHGAKMASIGDSITYGFIPRNNANYPGQLDSYAKITAERLGMQFVNAGESGSTVANVDGRSPMCMRFDSLPNDADVVTVMGGTNDSRFGVRLGVMSDRGTDTFYGALHTLLGGLYKKYFIDQTRNVKIVVMTPIKLLKSSASEIGGTGDLFELDEWCDAIKEVAAHYSFPVLDMYNVSRINPHLNQTVQGTEEGYTGVYNPYITDGTHPTQEGHELMADALVGFIRALD